MSIPESRVSDPEWRVKLLHGKYYHVKLAGTKYIKLHIQLWIEKNGEIPGGYGLYCKDGDTMNPDPDNWIMLTIVEGTKHNRMRAHSDLVGKKKRCSRCGNEFSTNNPTLRICDKCRVTTRERMVTDKRAIQHRCKTCGKLFSPSKQRYKYCSDECAAVRKKEQKKAYKERVKIKEIKVAKPKIKTKPVLKPKATDQQKNIRLRPEKTPVSEMFELNRNAPKNDREMIEKKGIVSPDLSVVEYKYYDPKLRIIRFFRSKERYEEFMAGVEK